MTPLVTAIVPTHNRTHLLPTTLRTILWQRNVDLEVIVVDDGSTDDTAAAVDAFGDGRIRLLRNETALGVSAARNRGADEARGRWLAFCDDDDLWAPDKLERQLAAAEATGRRWSYGGAVHVNLALRVLSAKAPPTPEDLVAALPGWSAVPGGSSNVIVRADTFERAGRWDPDLVNLADWDLWARLAGEGTPACVDAPLVGYRIHPSNASADTGLILREARVLDGRYGAALDYGQLHHYLAWVYLRSGRRRPALADLGRAAVRGQLPAVARTGVGLARGWLGRRIAAVQARPSRRDREWIERAERWISPLRGDEPEVQTPT